MHFGGKKILRLVRGPKLQVGVSNFAQKFSFFSTSPNFDLKKEAQFNRITIPSQGPLNEISLKKNQGFASKIGPVRAIFVPRVQNSGLWLYRRIFSKFMPFDFEAL